MYTWENGHPCDGRGPGGLPKINEAISEQIYADAIAYLKSEGCEIVKGGGPSPSGSAVGGVRKVIGDPSLLAPSHEALKEALSRCPNTPDNFPERNDFVAVTAAVKASCGGDEEFYADVFEEWALEFPGNDQEYVQHIWDSIERSELGWQWLADRTCYNTPERVFADPVPAEYLDDAPPLAPGAMTRKVNRPNIVFLDQVGQASSEPPDFVEGTFCDGQMAVVYGESGVGKTFLVSYLAMCVSLGWTWHGREVERGGVIYIAGEGGAGLQHRITAFRQHHGIDKTAGAQIAIIPTGVNFRDGREVDGLIEIMREAAPRLGGRVRLLVVDTLSRAIAGGNENSPDDMGALVAGADRLRAATGVHVLFIHHSGKDDSKGARGHSLLRAAVDSEFKVERPGDSGGVITMTATKQRDLECDGKPIAFKLRPVELGKNRRGKPITSCVVESVETPPSKNKRLPDDAQKALTILRGMLPENGDDDAAIPMEDWRRAVCAAWKRDGFDNRATLRKKFLRARDVLAAARSIEIRGDDVTVPWTAWMGEKGGTE
jgi:hypothetical protein